MGLFDIDFSGQTLMTIGIYLICLILSIAVHEYCHAVAADRLGDPTPGRDGRLTLNPAAHADPVGTLIMPVVAALTAMPLLGWGRPVETSPTNYTRRVRMRVGMAIVAAAGPFGNFLLMMAVLAIAGLVGRTMGMSEPIERVLQVMLQLNLILMVFNLLPLHPLDGGKILAAILPTRLDYIDDFLLRYGPWILLGLVLVGSRWLGMLLAPLMLLIERMFMIVVGA